MTIIDACISGDLVAISTLAGSSFQVRLLRLKIDGSVTIVKTLDLPGDVTCLYLASFMDSPHIVAGVLIDGTPTLCTYHVDEDADVEPRFLDLCSGA